MVSTCALGKKKKKESQRRSVGKGNSIGIRNILSSGQDKIYKTPIRQISGRKSEGDVSEGVVEGID